MIKLAVVTAVAAVFFFTGCSGASPSGAVPDSTEAPASAAPAASLASGTATGASADKGASTPSSAPPADAPGAPAPAAAAPGNGCQLEVEPNDTRAQAQVIALVDGVSATACGALGKATDEDWFVVHVTGGILADLTVTMTTTDAVTLQVIAPSGDTYEESHGAGATGGQAGAIDAWDGAGDYVIHVKSATHAQVSYSLALIVEQ